MVEIVPVMDVMSGIVVHAVSGKRDEYRPLKSSTIASSPKPEDVLWGFKRLGCREVYIADLDAILGKGNNYDVIDVALSYGFKVLADIGRRGLEKADCGSLAYVIGTEYIDYPDELRSLNGRIVSLDIKSGKVAFRNIEIEIPQAVNSVCNQNVKMVIVLNLDLVGTLSGVNTYALSTVKGVCRADIAVGGGIKSVEELMLLKELGVGRVLVATAIHKGIINQCRYP